MNYTKIYRVVINPNNDLCYNIIMIVYHRHEYDNKLDSIR